MEEIRDCYEANLQSIQLEEWCFINHGFLDQFEDIFLRLNSLLWCFIDINFG